MGSAVAKRLAEIENRGISLESREGKIVFKAARGSLQDEDKRFLKENKPEVLKYLDRAKLTMRDMINHVEVTPGEPFPLTDIQSAYILGRNEIRYGSVSCQILLELEYDGMDPARCREVWQELTERHEMLRASFTLDGYQAITNKKEFQVDYHDYSSLDDRTAESRLAELREKTAARQFDLRNEFPFSVAVIRLRDRSLMQLLIEFIVADWTSVMMLLKEFETRYFEPGKACAGPPELTFHKYMAAYEKYTDSIAYEKDKLYWLEKIKTLPPAPAIEITGSPSTAEARFKRYRYQLSPEKYIRFRDTAHKYKVTPTAALLTAYAAVLGLWSGSLLFSLNLTLLNRMDADEQIREIAGDFTTTDILGIDMREKKKFCEYCSSVGAELFENIGHRLFSGVRVVREYARQKNADMAFFPYVFTSAIGQIKSSLRGKMTDGCVSSTPQVFIDCQAMDGDFGLSINWDVRQGIIPEKTVEKMFETFGRLLDRLAEQESVWEQYDFTGMPSGDRRIIDAANATEADLPVHLLHSEILKRMEDCGGKIAAKQGTTAVTYREIGEYGSGVAAWLRKAGVRRNENIGIILPRSVYQLYAVTGILGAGCVYVPIDSSGAVSRRDEILSNCGITKVITVSSYREALPEGVDRLNVDEAGKGPLSSLKCENALSDTAYIIHTSGSTGKPKGVVITHESAVNTIEDINARFGITGNDAVLALSNLWFDLSVYDIFGILSVGGTVVYPENERYTDPSHWAELVEREGITVWNSVPALMRMYCDHIRQEGQKPHAVPRIVMLSGDWIDLDLFDDLKPFAPDTRFISLGGATEASIWSIFYEYKQKEDWWQSIPYGKPLSNQSFRILNEKKDECPVGVKGELYIAGKGLAKEYFNSPDITEKSFLCDEKGKRLYRTGDFGKYLDDGNIEFLGRIDNQVKVHGYRIELGEIENALHSLPYVKECIAAAVEVRAREKAICALIVSSGQVSEDKMIRDISGLLPKYMYPRKIFFTETIPLSANGKTDRRQSAAIIREKLNASGGVPDSCGETEITDDILRTVRDVWRDVLHAGDIDINEDLYDEGADSVVMSLAATRINKLFEEKVAFDQILVQMLNYPTIRETADFIKESIK